MRLYFILLVLLCLGSCASSKPQEPLVECTEVINEPDLEAKLIGEMKDYFSYRNPYYPEEARKEGIQGSVRIEFVIDTDGKTQKHRVINGLGGGLNESAIKFFRTLRYEPAKQGGLPVCSKKVEKVDFFLGR